MKNTKRIFALLMAVCLVVSIVPVRTVAEEEENTTCTHTHTCSQEVCGFVAAAEASACQHVHDWDCWKKELTCSHTHDEVCGYTTGTPDTPEVPCDHVHGECSYVKAVEGKDAVDCDFVHSVEICGCDGVDFTNCQHTHSPEVCAYADAVTAVAGVGCDHKCENGGCSFQPFVPGIPGTDCTHTEHTRDCYTVVKECREGHTDTSVCTDECMVPVVENCVHTQHDAACGYAEETEGAPCNWHCPICPVQALMDALPEVTVENKDEVKAQLAAIETAMEALRDEEKSRLALDAYTAAKSAVKVLECTHEYGPWDWQEASGLFFRTCGLCAEVEEQESPELIGQLMAPAGGEAPDYPAIRESIQLAVTEGTITQTVADMLCGTLNFETIPEEEPTAQESTTVAMVGDQEFSTVQEAVNAVKDGTASGTVVMQQDSTENLSISGITVTLDLNGYVLKSSINDTSVITLESSAKLTIKDTPSDRVHYGTLGINDLWIWDPNATSGVAIYGGVITGGYKTNNNGGGGVKVPAGCSLVMEGGTIAGNRVTGSGNSNAGGIHVTGAGSMFTMGDGAICYNVCEAQGGGVMAGGSSTFVMNGGSIHHNTASKGGGVTHNNIFTMNGGSICNNTATNPSNTKLARDIAGGGILVNGSASVFTMNGGSITGNQAVSNDGKVAIAGGVHMTGSMKVSNTVDITGNLCDGVTSNVYLNEGKAISLTEEGLNLDSRIGYTLTSTLAKVTDGCSNETWADCFVSDADPQKQEYYNGEVWYNRGGHITEDVTEGIFLVNGTKLFEELSNAIQYVAGTEARIEVLDDYSTDKNFAIPVNTSIHLFSNKPVTITGTGEHYQNTGLFLVPPTATLTLSGDLTIVGSKGNTRLRSFMVSGGKLIIQGDVYITGFYPAKETDTDEFETGAAIWVLNSGDVTIEGGRISGNYARNGGAIAAGDTAVVTITNGEISQNEARNTGGAIRLDGMATLNLYGGKIINNNAGASGGGIYKFSETTIINLAGNPVVTGNWDGNNSPSNLMLSTSKHFITLTGSLTSGAAVGVIGHHSNGKFTVDRAITYAETDTEYYIDAAKYIIPDEAAFVAVADDTTKSVKLASKTAGTYRMVANLQNITTQDSSEVLLETGKTYTVNIKANAGYVLPKVEDMTLAEGIAYNRSDAVTGSITFTCSDSDLTVTLEAVPKHHIVDFDDLVYAETPVSKSVTLVSDNATDTILSSENVENDHFTVATDGLVVTITPKGGLGYGRYTEKFTFTTSDSATHYIWATVIIVKADSAVTGKSVSVNLGDSINLVAHTQRAVQTQSKSSRSTLAVPDRNYVSFYCEGQLLGTEEVVYDTDNTDNLDKGTATLVYDTLNGPLTVGENTIRLVYGGGDNLLATDTAAEASGTMTVTVNPPQLSVTVPTAMTVTITAQGEMTATDCTIKNSSKVPVYLTGLEYQWGDNAVFQDNARVGVSVENGDISHTFAADAMTTDAFKATAIPAKAGENPGTLGLSWTFTLGADNVVTAAVGQDGTVQMAQIIYTIDWKNP